MGGLDSTSKYFDTMMMEVTFFCVCAMFHDIERGIRESRLGHNPNCYIEIACVCHFFTSHVFISYEFACEDFKCYR